MSAALRPRKARRGEHGGLDLCIKRIYEKPVRRDGYRVLVDRLWPRGVSRDSAALDEWLRDVAPTTGLRQWFAHEPSRFGEFRERYLEELASHGSALDALRARATEQRVTLLYAARDRQVNHTVVLAEAIRARAGSPRRNPRVR